MTGLEQLIWWTVLWKDGRGVTLDEQQLETMLVLALELHLQSFEKELNDFGLPQMTNEELITNTDPVIIIEEKD